MNNDLLQKIKARQASPAAGERLQAAARAGRKRRSPWLVLMLLGSGAMVAVLAAGSVVAGPALASMAGGSDWQSGSQPAPTHPRSFAQVLIPKPAHTQIALFASAPTATLPALTFEAVTVDDPATELPAVEEPVTTPGALFAELVVDTPTLEYAAEPSQEEAPAPYYGGNKYILVDISEQHMYVYENEALLFSFVASTGMNNATATGQFSVLDKIPSAYGSTWDIWMPNWLGIYWAGGLENGIHALPILPNGGTLWSGFLGRPISYGCVVLGSYDAQVLYDWAEVGTPVEIRW
jgi:lipoprotein-anchoring transpeptidase ErfK/SrfK